VRQATERELAMRNLDRDSHLLRNVRGAQRRIEKGCFGVCLHCEEDISPKRLAAVPWTAFCIQCQEIADRSQGDSADNLDELLLQVCWRNRSQGHMEQLGFSAGVTVLGIDQIADRR
jgi:DnaK suppressor protein